MQAILEPQSLASTSLRELMREMLVRLGEDPERDGLRHTPERMERSLHYLTKGYQENPEEILRGAMFDVAYDEMAIVKDIEMFSLCEHHLLPFFGKVHVAYIPRGEVIGLSKVPRLVDVFARRLQVQERLTTATVKKVLSTWGPGCFDAELDKDGKALRPDGKRACTLIPPAFGLAGVNLHTWTGFGSVTYWNAYVAATEMHGSGTFFDARFKNAEQYPVAAKSGSGNTRGKPDLVTSKLAALHFYQLAIPAPKPQEGSFARESSARGKVIFNGKANCASCHVQPLFTEPGNNLHAPSEIGVDSWQADRSPTHMYRTAPLAGLWSHQKGGFYHNGRFATLPDVIEHYDEFFKLQLTDQEKRDLSEYLKSL